MELHTFDIFYSLTVKMFWVINITSQFLFQSIPEKSMVLLHVCAHNPTGVDPKVWFYI